MRTCVGVGGWGLSRNLAVSGTCKAIFWPSHGSKNKRTFNVLAFSLLLLLFSCIKQRLAQARRCIVFRLLVTSQSRQNSPLCVCLSLNIGYANN